MSYCNRMSKFSSLQVLHIGRTAFSLRHCLCHTEEGKRSGKDSSKQIEQACWSFTYLNTQGYEHFYWLSFINKNQNKKVYSSCIMSTDIFLSFVTTLHFMRHAISSEQTGGDVFINSWIVVRLDIYLGQIRSFKGSQHHMNMILTSKQIEFLKYMFFLESVQNTFCWTKSNRCIVIDYF